MAGFCIESGNIRFMQPVCRRGSGTRQEYKKAFMETGGTEEEWEAHDINIHVGYEIKAQTEAYLSFAVQGTENWSSATVKQNITILI